MEQSDIRRQVIRYYAGQLSAEEEARLLERLDMLSVRELEAVYPAAEWAATNEQGQVDTAAAFRRHLQKRGKQQKIFRLPAARLWKAACVIGILLTAGYFFMNTDKDAARPHTGFKTIQTKDGRFSHITLPDGSQVTVNGGTTLRIPEPFTGRERTIFLDGGEAFFDISQDAARPFVVHTAHVQVQVLGTSFSVRDYAGEETAAVVVSTGKVAVSRQQDTLYLLAGNKAALDKGTGSFSKLAADAEKETGWMRREYAFSSASLEEITRQLAHGYGVTFEVKDDVLLQKKFSATFRRNTIRGIMEQLHLMAGIQYTIQDSTIIIQ